MQQRTLLREVSRGLKLRAEVGFQRGAKAHPPGQFRRNYLVSVPSVQNLEELDQLLLAGSVEEQNRMIAGRTQGIGAAMIAEEEDLLALTEEGFELASLHFPISTPAGAQRR
jgi:hypothetical protein